MLHAWCNWIGPTFLWMTALDPKYHNSRPNPLALPIPLGAVALFFQSTHRQSLNDGFPHEECEHGNRQHDQGSGGADTGPVDLSVRDEVIDGHRNGFRLRTGEDQGEEKLIPGKDKGDDGRGRDAVSDQGQHDNKKTLQAGTPVDHGCVLQLRRHPLEKGDH